MDIHKPEKVNITQNSEEKMEARFMNFCENFTQSGLLKDEDNLKQALHLFGESKHLFSANAGALGTGSPEENERYWMASILYTVMRLDGVNSVAAEGNHDSDEGFILSQIVRLTNLNIMDFFKEMPQFLVKAGYILNTLYGSDWEKRLQAKEAQANFTHLTELYEYYKRIYKELFLSGESCQGKSWSRVSNCDEPFSSYLRFGWMLFLALRIHVFGRFKDLVTCANGLVSIMAILIIHIPVTFRKFSLNDSTRFVRRSSKGIDLIASLCNIYHTSHDDLSKTIEKVNTLIKDILKKNPFPGPECQARELEDIDTDGFSYFEGLMEETSLKSSIRILESNYMDAIHDRGELDERMFVNDEDSLFGSVRASVDSVNILGAKRKYEAISSPMKRITSPLSSPVSPSTSGTIYSNVKMLPPTPVSTTMTTAKWLRTVIAPLPAEPCKELKQFFASCDKDVTDDLISRAHIVLETIFPSSGSQDLCVARSLHSAVLMDRIWAVQRRMEALKLYYRVLDAMCRAESHRLQSRNLTSLLANDRFHRCMLACSAELVLATHKTVTMMFPAVLEVTGITAFDFSKVIESFVRHEETLPRELKRHLNALEERLLESLAWEKGSSMYNSLIVAKPCLAAEINRLGLLADPMPLLDMITSPYNPSLRGFQIAVSAQRFQTASDQDIAMPSSPPRQATSLPVTYNDTAVAISGSRNCFVSPSRSRPSAFSAFSTPNSKLQPPLQSAFASPHRPSPLKGGETCAETVINIFLQKVMKLAAIRIKNLCERLQLPNHIMGRVYRLIERILNHETSLFFNRHIDQLILCSLYGVSKVCCLNLTFKEIIVNYRKQPQCKPQVFRNIFIDGPTKNFCAKVGPKTVDIITFYNDVFIHSVKTFLLQLGDRDDASKNESQSGDVNQNDGPTPASPRPSPFVNLPDLSPKKISTMHNIYVSPLRSSKMESLNSPHSKSFYACVGESTHAFQSPSKDLTAINNHLNKNNPSQSPSQDLSAVNNHFNSRRVAGRINFDKPGLVSDSLVAGSLNSSQKCGHLISDSVSLGWTKSVSPLKRQRTDN